MFSRGYPDENNLPMGSGLRLALCGVLLTSLLYTTGCNALGVGNGKLLRELQSENDRLLSEFRAERARRQEVEKAKRVVEERLAESEKLVARQYSGASRISRIPAPNFNAPGGFNGSAGVPFSDGLSGLSGGGFGTADPNSGLRWQRRISP